MRNTFKQSILIYLISGYRFNNIGSIPSVLADRIRIRKTFADSELTPYINLPCGFTHIGGGYQSISPELKSSLSPMISPTLSSSSFSSSDGFTGSRRLKMLAESYQSQRHEMAMLSCGPKLMTDVRIGETERDKVKNKLSFSIESILA